MFTARFLAIPVIALTVIVALAQAHSQPGMSPTEPTTIDRAVNCATPDARAESACTLADNAPVAAVR